MASKRTGTRTRPVNAASLKTVRELTRRARVELVTLLGQNRRGTITQPKLKTGLKKLHTKLEKILMYEYRL
jgi:hypothetical protein